MLNADSMAGRVMTLIDAVPAPDQANTANLTAYRYEIIKAICEGIIEEIKLHMEINVCQDHAAWVSGEEAVK